MVFWGCICGRVGCGEGGLGGSEATGEPTASGWECSPLGRRGGVEATGAEITLEEGGVSAAQEDVAGLVGPVQYWPEPLDEAPDELCVAAVDK